VQWYKNWPYEVTIVVRFIKIRWICVHHRCGPEDHSDTLIMKEIHLGYYQENNNSAITVRLTYVQTHHSLRIWIIMIKNEIVITSWPAWVNVYRSDLKYSIKHYSYDDNVLLDVSLQMLNGDNVLPQTQLYCYSVLLCIQLYPIQ